MSPLKGSFNSNGDLNDTHDGQKDLNKWNLSKRNRNPGNTFPDSMALKECNNCAIFEN